MLKTLQSIGTGATLLLAKAHGSVDSAAHTNNLPKFAADDHHALHQPADTMHTPHNKNPGRRALYDQYNLPYCNEVFPGGQTRGERYGQRNMFGVQTCQGPAVPSCGQRLYTGVTFAQQYPAYNCARSDGSIRPGK